MFTEEELEAAALRYLTSEVATSRSQAGIRDIGAIKTQIYEIIAAAFMLRPGAVFSVCWLASNALFAEVSAQLTDLRAIIEAAPRVSRPSQRVESVTELHNAEASLITLTAAFSARSSGVAGGIGPAVQRFSASVERFVRGELVKNVVAEGEIVETGEELQAKVAAHWAEARPRHARIVDALERFTTALAAYEGVRLPDSVVASLLARIQARLGTLTTEMAGAVAPAVSREAMLDLFAMRTLLRQAAQFRPPVLRKAPLTGDAATGTLVGGSGNAASILGSVSGPFDYDPGTVFSYSVGDDLRSITLPGTGVQVPAEEVRAALALDPDLAVTLAQTTVAPFVGRRSAAVGQEGVLEHHVAEGADLVATGGVLLTARLNFAEVGVEPGMKLVLPGLNETRQVVAVEGGTVMVDAEVAAGTHSYYIGPDYRSVPPGAAVYITGDPDQGTTYVTAGHIASLELGFDLASAAPMRAQVLDQRLVLSLRTPDVGAAGALSVAPHAGAAALGLEGTALSAVSRFDTRVDLAARGVTAGDQLFVQLPGAVVATRFDITGIEGTVATFTPPMAVVAGALFYQIDDARVSAYRALCDELRLWMTVDAFDRADALDMAMSRLSRGARYTGQLAETVASYTATLEQLARALSQYVVPRDPAVEQAVRMMTEHGFDRAVDLFLALRLAEFFALDADGVSYKTWVIRAAAEVARQVVPVSKDTRGPTAGWRTIAVEPTANDLED